MYVLMIFIGKVWPNSLGNSILNPTPKIFWKCYGRHINLLQLQARDREYTGCTMLLACCWPLAKLTCFFCFLSNFIYLFIYLFIQRKSDQSASFLRVNKIVQLPPRLGAVRPRMDSRCLTASFFLSFSFLQLRQISFFDSVILSRRHTKSCDKSP